MRTAAVRETPQHPSPEQRSDEDTERDGRRELGVDVTAAQVDARRGGRRDPDHEVAGGRADLHGQAHGPVHGDHLERARADAEKARDDARQPHDPEAERYPAGRVGDVPLETDAVVKPASRRRPALPSAAAPRDLVEPCELHDSRPEQHHAEQDQQRVLRERDQPPARPGWRQRWWPAPGTCRCACSPGHRARRPPPRPSWWR